MRTWSRLASLARNLWRKSAVERELDDELGAALQTLEDRYVASGMPRADARRAARLELGGVEQIKEHVRDGRAGAAIDAAWMNPRTA